MYPKTERSASSDVGSRLRATTFVHAVIPLALALAGCGSMTTVSTPASPPPTDITTTATSTAAVPSAQTSSSTTDANSNAAGGVPPAGCSQMSSDLTRMSNDLVTFAADTTNQDARDTVIGDLEAVKSDFSDIESHASQPGDKQTAAAGVKAAADTEKGVWAASNGDPGANGQLTAATGEMNAQQVPGVCGG